MSVKSFFESVGREIEKLFGHAASVEQKILTVVKVAAPFVAGLISMVDPSAAAFISGIVTTAETDLGILSTAAQQGSVAAGTPVGEAVTTALQSLSMNLSGILQVAEVKSSAKIAAITTDVNMLTGEFEALLGILVPNPANTAPAASPAPATTATGVVSD